MKYILTLLLILSVNSFAGDLIQGTVTKVYDGDTITVTTNHGKVKVRLYGIDAPEKDQDYGRKSTRLLDKLIDNEKVQVYVVDTDRYGRAVGKVFFKGEYINAVMIREGAAWHYKKYSKDIELTIAEEWARQEREGLWREDNPTAPWDYRHE